MKFGLLFHLQDPPTGDNIPRLYDEVFEQAEFAERLGFDAFFVPEHHQMPDGYLPAPLTFIAALAAKTHRAEIGTSIMQLPLCHPLHVAEQIAVIDNLAKGRFILGAGLGLVQKEFDAFQIPLTDAASRFTESVEILKRAWTGQPFSFNGRHFQFTDVMITPRPVRQPRPPIWIGAMSEITLKRAGRIADGWLSDPFPLQKETWHSQVAMYEKDYDVDYVIMRFRLPDGPEHNRVPDCIRLFGEEVLPKFHK